jgi:hypothetical protein
MSKYKKGVQYSNYCGTELQNFLDTLWLIEDNLKKGIDSKDTLILITEAKDDINKLRVKISDLDNLNNFER